jgi:hypothetical protein
MGISLKSLREAIADLPDDAELEPDFESSKFDVYLRKKWLGGLQFFDYENFGYYTAESLKKKKTA